MDSFVVGFSLAITLLCGGILALAWIAYPALRAFRGGKKPGEEMNSPPGAFSVAAILATRDEPPEVAKKVRNILSLPDAELFASIVIAVDVTGSWEVEAYSTALLDSRVKVVPGNKPGGKACSLNAAVEASPPAPFLMVVDTSQTLEPGAVTTLVTTIDAKGWAGASGVVKPEKQGLLGKVWQVFEMGIRSGQARAKGLVTTSGAITMVRWESWIPLPVGTICDDLFLTMGVAKAGGIIGLCPDAVAKDPRSIPPKLGFQKKVRTLTGLWQYILMLEPSALNPRKNPLWVDFVFHKLMRVATPFLALITALGAVSYLVFTGMMRGIPYLGWWALLCTILALGILGNSSLRWRVFTLAAPAVATWKGLRKDWNVWDRAEKER